MPSSTHPRATNDDFKDWELDDNISDLAADLLDEFDVDPDEKEFLAESLRIAPKSELDMLRKAKDQAYPDFNDPIADFARSHPLYERLDKDVDEGALAQFSRDVFEFSRASGVPRKKSKDNARLSVAAWMKAVGLGDEPEAEAVFKHARVKNGVPILTTAEDYYKHYPSKPDQPKKPDKPVPSGKKEKKRNRKQKILNDVKAAAGAIEAKVKRAATATAAALLELEPNNVDIPTIGEKRRRDTSESVPSQNEAQDQISHKRRRKERKKPPLEAIRPDKAKAVEHNGTVSTAINSDAVKTSNGQHNTTTQEEAALPTQQTSGEPMEPKQKTPVPGPTKSAYFPKLQPPVISQPSFPSVQASLAAVSSSSLSKRAKKRQRLEASKLENPGLDAKATQPTASPHFKKPKPNPVENTTIDISSHPPRSLSDEVTLKPADGNSQSHPERTDEAGNLDTKRKRKRKKNHNRLSEGTLESPAVAIHDGRDGQVPPQLKEQGRQTLSEPLVDKAGRGEESKIFDSSNTKVSAKRKRGDRGRGRAFKSQQASEKLGRIAVEPTEHLAELDNANATSQMPGRRDRGRKRSSVVKPSFESNDEPTKGRHL